MDQDLGYYIPGFCWNFRAGVLALIAPCQIFGQMEDRGTATILVLNIGHHADSLILLPHFQLIYYLDDDDAGLPVVPFKHKPSNLCTGLPPSIPGCSL